MIDGNRVKGVGRNIDATRDWSSTIAENAQDRPLAMLPVALSFGLIVWVLKHSDGRRPC